MLKVLVAINPDLPSSFALRYLGRLARGSEMEIEGIHAHEQEIPDRAADVGWARRSWEKAMVEKCEKEIELLISAEQQFCPAPISATVKLGDPHKRILERLATAEYHLFAEGAPLPFDVKAMEKRFESSLYQYSPTPILLVRSLCLLERVLLIAEDEPCLDAALSMLTKLWRADDIPVDVGRYGGEKPWDEQQTRSRIQSEGYFVDKVSSDDQTLNSLDSSAYGLLAVGLYRNLDRSRSLLRMLGKFTAPILFCWAE